MDRVRYEEATRKAQPADPAHFSGRVRQLPVFTSTEAQPVRTLLVAFEAGARTHWHRHTGGQVLHVLEGRGRTQVRGQAAVELGPGDIVSVPADEEHWHGAAEGATMTHLAISLGTTEWGGPPE